MGIALAVTVIPIGGALVGWVGAISTRWSGTLVWLGSGVLGLFFFSPGLLGIPYFASAALMLVAAMFRAQVRQLPPSPTA
jgi:hypothetical protein